MDTVWLNFFTCNCKAFICLQFSTRKKIYGHNWKVETFIELAAWETDLRQEPTLALYEDSAYTNSVGDSRNGKSWE